MQVTDELRARIRAELPEIEEISDPALRDKVVEAWSFAIANSSFEKISDMKASGNPETAPMKAGTQAEHLRAVARLSVAIADTLSAMFPDIKFNRDTLIAGGLCHDLGKAFEFDPENQKRWQANPRATGFPSVRHPPFGVHVAMTAGLPEEIVHISGGHSGEGELITRSLENTVVHFADYTFWDVLGAAGLLDEGKAR